MIDWTVKYRENNSFWIEAHDDYSKFLFTSHALDRIFDRTTNMKDVSDLEKPVRRIVKCLSHYRVDKWIMQHEFGTKLIIHDNDIRMAYIIVCKCNRYDIISTFNEFWKKYDNTHDTPELWVSLSR